jgi:mannose/fructose/N-acetylgalactosamine-specific phosphotransferase system component IIC
MMLGLLAGLFSLDETALVQSWFSQPLSLSVLTGAFCGDPLTGLAIGLPVQLVLAGNLPVGQSFIGDPVTSLVAVVGSVILSGRSLPPVLRMDVLSEIPFVGWMILAVAIFSSAGHLMIQWERRLNSTWMLQGHRTLRDGQLSRIENIHARCLLTTFVRGAVTTVILLMVLRGWIQLFDRLPYVLTMALGMLPLLLPGLGIGNLIDRYGLRQSWAWMGAGAVVAFAVTRYVI